jgi:non-homologous end joining protein Ku
LAPDQGGEKPYRLLADAMEKVGRVALAEMVSHNKENLVLIRPAKGGLIMQVMFYADEVRDFAAIPRAEGQRLTPEEFELASGLVEKNSLLKSFNRKPTRMNTANAFSRCWTNNREAARLPSHRQHVRADRSSIFMRR